MAKNPQIVSVVFDLRLFVTQPPPSAADMHYYDVVLRSIVDTTIGQVFQVRETIERRAKGLRYVLGRRKAKTLRWRHNRTQLTWATRKDAVEDLLWAVLREGVTTCQFRDTLKRAHR